jgi:hypothetical protein
MHKNYVHFLGINIYFIQNYFNLKEEDQFFFEKLSNNASFVQVFRLVESDSLLRFKKFINDYDYSIKQLMAVIKIKITDSATMKEIRDEVDKINKLYTECNIEPIRNQYIGHTLKERKQWTYDWKNLFDLYFLLKNLNRLVVARVYHSSTGFPNIKQLNPLIEMFRLHLKNLEEE